MKNTSSETFETKCSQKDSSPSFTAQSNFAFSVVDATTSIPSAQWSADLVRRLIPKVLQLASPADSQTRGRASLTQRLPSRTLNDHQLLCNVRREVVSEEHPAHSMATKSSETFDTKASQINYHSGQSESGEDVADATVSISVNPCPVRLMWCLSPGVAR